MVIVACLASGIRRAPSRQALQPTDDTRWIRTDAAGRPIGPAGRHLNRPAKAPLVDTQLDVTLQFAG
jgi:hypothetical protein